MGMRKGVAQVKEEVSTILGHKGIVDPREVPEDYTASERLQLAQVFVLTELYQGLFTMLKKLSSR